MAISSAESEFRSIAQGSCGLLWLKIILNDSKVELEGPMKLYCDNKSEINIAHNPIQHERQNILKLIDTLSRKNCKAWFA